VLIASRASSTQRASLCGSFCTVWVSFVTVKASVRTDALTVTLDLRIRNFTNRFGACDIIVVDGTPTKVDFHA
jgi:hypothetical protein